MADQSSRHTNTDSVEKGCFRKTMSSYRSRKRSFLIGKRSNECLSLIGAFMAYSRRLCSAPIWLARQTGADFAPTLRLRWTLDTHPSPDRSSYATPLLLRLCSQVCCGLFMIVVDLGNGCTSVFTRLVGRSPRRALTICSQAITCMRSRPAVV